MKKILSMVLVLVLVAGIAVSGTMAYLTDRDNATNVFTVGDVDIELTGTFAKGVELLPGKTVAINPVIENVGKNDAWVWLTYAVPTGLKDAVVFGDAGTGWTAGEGPEDEEYTIYSVLYDAALEAGASTTVAFSTVALDKTIDITPDGDWYKVVGGQTTDLQWNTDDGAPAVYVNAYAIQKDQFANVDAALAAYTTQWGKLNGEMEELTVTEVATAAELTEAVAAGGVVVLTEDVTVTETMTVSAGKSTSINLNGNDISYAVSNSGASAIISNKGELNISGEGTISFVAENPDMQEIPAYATNTITNTGTGTLTIGEGVVVTNGSDGGASYAVDVQSGKLILDGGTLIGERCALRIARFNADTEFVMNSGLVKAATPAWIHLPGSKPTDAPKISVTINGGKLQSTKATSADNDVMYTYSFGNSHANTSVTINGGEFLGGTVSIGSGYKGDAPALTINGGTFEYDVLQWLENDASKVLYAANN